MNRYNDVFCEEIVVRKKQGIFNILYYTLNLFMYVFILLAIIGLQGILQGLGNTETLMTSVIWFLAFASLSVLIFFFKDNFKTDYEYSFTNGILDIAQVKNNKKRKEIMSVDTKKELEIVSPIMTDEFNKYQSMSGIKKVNVWLNRDMKKYFAVIRKDSQRIMLVFEPSEGFMAVLKKHNPQKVKL